MNTEYIEISRGLRFFQENFYKIAKDDEGSPFFTETQNVFLIARELAFSISKKNPDLKYIKLGKIYLGIGDFYNFVYKDVFGNLHSKEEHRICRDTILENKDYFLKLLKEVVLNLLGEKKEGELKKCLIK